MYVPYNFLLALASPMLLYEIAHIMSKSELQNAPCISANERSKTCYDGEYYEALHGIPCYYSNLYYSISCVAMDYLVIANYGQNC